MRAGGQVWVTRAEPGAAATAARLAGLGHRPLVAPLLRVRALAATATAEGGVEGAAALAFTSANAVRAFAGRWAERRLPVFAVGEATAAAARAAGFAEVRSAQGDVDALAGVLAAAQPAGRVLHPCGRERAGDLAAAVAPAGVAVQALPLYETLAAKAWPVEAAQALQRAEVAAVLLHSPKAARTLAALAARAPLDLSHVAALGLSPACLAPVRDLGLARAAAAGRPEEAALLALLPRPGTQA